MELYVVHRAAERIARDAGLQVSRRLVGPFMTSLDMAGVAITLLRLTPELRRFWDAPVRTPALCWGSPA
nr:dihydroxyacetone kinase subunit DhaK [Acidithiobacillus caldus]